MMQMVLPTILKRHHSLKGVKLLQAIRKIKLGQPESLKEYARIQKDIIKITRQTIIQNALVIKTK
jgi:hypothetical protein